MYPAFARFLVFGGMGKDSFSLSVCSYKPDVFGALPFLLGT
jgi:hypothetical protein